MRYNEYIMQKDVPSSSPSGNVVSAEPLTDAADLFALVGRFVASFVLMVLTIMLIMKQSYGPAVICGTVSLFMQVATTRMWRRLREEREAKKAARDQTVSETGDIPKEQERAE